MIKINLLPASMRVEQKTQKAAAVVTAAPKAAPREVSSARFSFSLGNIVDKLLLFALGGAVGLVVLVYLSSIFIPGWWMQGRLRHWQKLWKPMEMEFGNVDAASVQQGKDAVVLDELRAYTKDRVRWAKILNALSDVTPTSVQLVNVATTQLDEMVPAAPPPPDPKAAKNPPPPPPPKSNAPPPPPPMVKKTFTTMELQGIVARGSLGEEDLKNILDQMKSHAMFKEFFERIELVEVGTLPDTNKKFSIRCRFKEAGSS